MTVPPDVVTVPTPPGDLPVTLQATFVATLVDEWARAGITDAVVCPGSRSTPLAVALADDARLRVHVHHDERSAGFLALGLGLASGRPAVVLTTSGTAAVELHPAVVEASLAGVPMLICTADRPPELWDVGAPQTIDQTHLYGRAVRWFAEPGVAAEESRGSWRSLAARAVVEATGARPGPVHLNLPFRDPLLGTPGELPAGRGDDEPWHVAVGARVAAPEVDPAWRRGRGVIVAGGGVDDPDGVAELVDATGWPVLADPRSGCRVPGLFTVAAFDALLRVPSFAEGHRPDVVVRLGSPPASKVLSQWLASCDDAVQVVVASGGRWYDPEHTASAVVDAEPGGWCRAAAVVLGGAFDPEWARAWTPAEAAAQTAIGEVLAAEPALTEPAVARTLVDELPDGSVLVVGSSMPVRDVEWYGAPRPGVRVVANRGANGIDGVVSTAAGVALASGAPTVVLVGDVSFLHDTNALLGLADRRLDLTVVVVDNRGGGIFSFLPPAAALTAERFEQLFGTPHDADLVALAAAHGVPGTAVGSVDELRAALARSVGTPGVSVVIASTDRTTNVAVHDRIHAAVAARLDG